MKLVTASFLFATTFHLLACQADVGPYVVDVQRGPEPGTIKVIKCKTSVTNMGNLTAYENNGECTVSIVDIGTAPPPAPPPRAPAPPPSASPAPTPSQPL